MRGRQVTGATRTKTSPVSAAIVERYAALFIAQGLLLVLYDGLPE
jgi:hypothetical protein